MKIQSLSVVVPNRACINHCASCPSRMHDNNYPVLLDKMRPDFDQHLKDYLKRLEFARDNGCNTLMLTGTSEPQQNREFLTWFGMMMQMMETPFRSIEMQCTGALLNNNYLQFLQRHVGITMMALSVFSLDPEENTAIISPPKHMMLDPFNIAASIKAQGMGLRMCLNLTDYFDRFEKNPAALFSLMRVGFGADQLTLRVLYASEPDEKGCESPESKWVREHAAGVETVKALTAYVKSNGSLLGRLPYGADKYGLEGMSVVVDGDSMGKESDDVDSYKYLILRPNCRLYSSWDDTGSLVF